MIPKQPKRSIWQEALDSGLHSVKSEILEIGKGPVEGNGEKLTVFFKNGSSFTFFGKPYSDVVNFSLLHRLFRGEVK